MLLPPCTLEIAVVVISCGVFQLVAENACTELLEYACLYAILGLCSILGEATVQPQALLRLLLPLLALLSLAMRQFPTVDSSLSQVLNPTCLHS